MRKRALDDDAETDETWIGRHAAASLPAGQTAFWTLPALRQRVQT
jgi:hypothetical protein